MAAIYRGTAGLARFREAVEGSLVSQRVTVDEPEQFTARMHAGHAGGVDLLDTTFPPLTSERTDPRPADRDLVFLLVPLTAQGQVRHAGGAEPVRPGRVVVIPGSEPFTVRHDVVSRLAFVTMRAGRPGAPIGRLTSYDLNPVGAVLAATLPLLVDAASRRSGSSDVLDAVVRSTVDALVAGAPTPDGTRSAVERWLRLHLTDPGLRPDDAAAALGVSVRTLHRSLAGNGPSFARTLRAARVERATRLLEDTTWSVSDIAFASGFGSVSRFTVAFKEVHGRTPGEHRRWHGSSADLARNDASEPVHRA